MEKLCIIGGGITGIFSALSLSLDGYDVTLFERNSLLSGTSGRFHGMLHSGSRYSVNDPKSAKECINENKLLSKQASRFIKNTGGYFVALNSDEEEYGDKLLKSNIKNGIESEEMDVNDFLKIEPNINKKIRRVIKVPDKTIAAHNFSAAIALEAVMAGAKIKTSCNIIGANISEKNVRTIKYEYNGDIINKNFDYIINTTGPWSGKLLNSFGINNFDIMPTLGYMAVYNRLFVNSIINRMRLPSDGDIALPYGTGTVIGTLAIISDDPDQNNVDSDDIDMMISEISEMIPSLSNYNYKKLYYSMRPLIKGESSRGSRDFQIIKNFDNMISVIGGKFTTTRLMAENVSKKINQLYGNKNYDTKKIDFNSTFERYIDKYKSTIDKEFIDYIRSYNDGMDYNYSDYILSAYLLNNAIKRCRNGF